MFFYSFNIYKITLNCVTDKRSSAEANSMFREQIYRTIRNTEKIS
jgi:hypothetical protein